ncbi:Perilipin-2 [Homalodisca vitripennis]|nr:Perilipin-2 [Homalodisca vitripennis]
MFGQQLTEKRDNGPVTSAPVANRTALHIPAHSCTLLLHPSTQCEDKVLHTAHTVGRLSHKAGRRLYRSVNNRLRQVNLQNINEYLNSLRLVVHLTSYLNAVNQGVDHRTSNHTTSN